MAKQINASMPSGSKTERNRCPISPRRSRRVRLAPEKLQQALEQGGARKNEDVIVAASYFKGRGVFAARHFKPGEVMCFFRGLAVPMRDLENGPDQIRRRAYEYSFCDEQRDICAVPLRGLTELTPLPAHLSGHLINEATTLDDGTDFAPNVVVDFSSPEAFVPSSETCPFLEGRFLQWPLIATRKIHPGEELLLCYGAAYSARGGYSPSCSCQKS